MELQHQQEHIMREMLMEILLVHLKQEMYGYHQQILASKREHLDKELEIILDLLDHPQVYQTIQQIKYYNT